MAEPSETTAPGVLRDVHERREALRAAMDSLERALAGPAVGRTADWAAAVAAAADELVQSVDAHVTTTEGPGGLFEEVIDHAPRLTHTVDRLRRDHEEMRGAAQALVEAARGAGDETGAARVRDLALDVLGDFARHRHLGADLLYEAYSVDISAGD